MLPPAVIVIHLHNLLCKYLFLQGKTYQSNPSLYYFTVGGSCDCWCNVTLDDQCGDASSLCRYDILNNMQYANSTTMDGKRVNLFVFDDMLGPIDMAQNGMYVVDNSSTPVLRWERLTPFGTFEGNITQTYGGYTVGHSPDDSWTKSYVIHLLFFARPECRAERSPNQRCLNVLIVCFLLLLLFLLSFCTLQQGAQRAVLPNVR
jgi:hypothetical protein